MVAMLLVLGLLVWIVHACTAGAMRQGAGCAGPPFPSLRVQLHAAAADLRASSTCCHAVRCHTDTACSAAPVFIAGADTCTPQLLLYQPNIKTSWVKLNSKWAYTGRYMRLGVPAAAGSCTVLVCAAAAVL